MPTRDLDSIHDSRLASLFALHDETARTWNGDELRAIHLHQLAVPLRAEIPDARIPAALPGDLTFGQLLALPDPPCELLGQAKAFAKSCLDRPHELPPEIAKVLYYAAIAAARLRCGQSITQLAPDALRSGIAWALRQPWLDPATRALLAAAEP